MRAKLQTFAETTKGNPQILLSYKKRKICVIKKTFVPLQRLIMNNKRKLYRTMRHLLLFLMLTATTTAMANHPDSIYIRPDIKDGQMPFQIAYSIDRQHWTHLDYTLFSSDYGPWGKQKKLYYPVLQYDGKTYRASFIPDPNGCDIALTETQRLDLWKPQDYPTLSETEFKTRKQWQQNATRDNIIRIPYADFQRLLDRKRLADQNIAWEQENYVQTGEWLKDAVSGVSARLNINLDDRKAISPNLMGVFFEDISYAADGGLYAELIQNRDFEYSSRDRNEWNAMTAWHITGEGMSCDIKTDNPIHSNNPHYALLNTTQTGASLVNEGWDGIAVKRGEKYRLSLFLKGKGSVKVSLTSDGKLLAQATIKASGAWKQQTTTLIPRFDATNAQLEIQPLEIGTLALDFVSLFPYDTFKGHANGLRRDLAEAIADLHPRFVRFPGGCASHGNGIDNIYHWQATVGPLWERQSDFNIWHYHQTRGLGFYEYFQFCEDIGAEPLPVLAAGVPCQNSSVGGNGQQGGIPFERDLKGQPSPYIYNGKPLTMESYLQELLDLIEWANGDSRTSSLAAIRAKAGHPKPFNLKYLGIGNEDLLGDVFMERYRFLIEGVKKTHPEITIIGTVGPFWEGSDYEYGWQEAKDKSIAIVDEHYYNTPGWYFHHRDFYDRYDREGTKVYLGEWASKGNNVSNALVEAAYMTGLERNADVVVMSSYAPLLAKDKHTSWNPDLIYFNNTEIKPTANYYVQRAFGQNSGDTYVYSDLSLDYQDANGRNNHIAALSERFDKSVVIDSKTGDIIVKLVSLLPLNIDFTMQHPNGYDANVCITTMASPVSPDRQRQWLTNETSTKEFKNDVKLQLQPYSFTTLRFTKTKK